MVNHFILSCSYALEDCGSLSFGGKDGPVDGLDSLATLNGHGLVEHEVPLRDLGQILLVLDHSISLWAKREVYLGLYDQLVICVIGGSANMSDV